MDEKTEKRIKGFTERHPINCFARVYANKPELVDKRVEAFSELFKKVYPLEFNGRRIVKQFTAIVPTNQEYKGKLDCGLTANAIRSKYDPKLVDVVEVPYGGPFAAALNMAMVKKLAEGYRHAFIFSSEAKSAINLETVLANIEAHVKGALYSGVAFDDLAPRVYAGHIMNTWAFLNIYEAMSVGGFNPLAEQAIDETQQFSLTAKDESGRRYVYPVQGCEEGPLIAELSKAHEYDKQGFVTAAITGAEIYQPLPGEEERHREKVMTKKVRMDSLLVRCGHHPSYIWHALMPEYRREEYRPE